MALETGTQLSLELEGLPRTEMDLKWSFSAHALFRRCQRQFFFAQIAALHSAPAGSLRREAYLLSQLQTLQTWAGRVVHRAIELFVVPALRERRCPEASDAVRNALDLAAGQLAYSEAGEYRREGATKSGAGDRFCALFDHEYGRPLKPENVGAALAKVERATRAACEAPEVTALVSGHRSYWTEAHLPFRIGGALIDPRIDLLCFGEEDRVTVVDWKSGESQSGNSFHQLATYALAVRAKWPHVVEERIRLVEVSLLIPSVREQVLLPGELIEAEDFIYQSAREIYALTLGKSYAEQCLDDFERAHSPNSCIYCKFQRLCLEAQ